MGLGCEVLRLGFEVWVAPKPGYSELGCRMGGGELENQSGIPAREGFKILGSGLWVTLALKFLSWLASEQWRIV